MFTDRLRRTASSGSVDFNALCFGRAAQEIGQAKVGTGKRRSQKVQADGQAAFPFVEKSQ